MNHDPNELTQEIIDIVKTVTRSDLVDGDSSIENLSNWDSLAYMSIISEIEINYEVEVNEENINNFSSIKSIVDIVLSKNK